MSNQSADRLSALLDGECSSHELDRLLADLERDPELGARWSRQCAARDAQAGVTVRAGLDLTAGVMAAIADDSQDSRATVIPLRGTASPAAQPAGGRVRRAASRWLPMAGWAAAASVTAVALVAGRAPTGGSEAAGQQVALAPAGQGAPAVASHWAEIDPVAAQRLDGYLMEHSNSRASTGMGGSLGYARLAVTTADYRPDESR